MQISKAFWDRKFNGDKTPAVGPIESIRMQVSRASWDRKCNVDEAPAVGAIETIV